MTRDPIPTFRRGGRLLIHALLSPRVWKWCGVSLLTLVLLALLGVIGALASRSTCERRVRAYVQEHFEIRHITDIEWATPGSLRPVPFPAEWLDPALPFGSPHSLFAPKITFKVDSSESATSNDARPHSWAMVRGATPLPFIVRVHYRFGHSVPREGRVSGDVVRWTHSGSYSVGVVTYLGAFGVATELDHWSTGASFN